MHAPLTQIRRQGLSQHSLTVVRSTLSQTAPQSLIGIAVAGTAVSALGLALATHWSLPQSGNEFLLLLVLTVAIAGSRLWPLRLGPATRLYIASVPIYLITCVFAPPLAALAVGVGMLSRELSVCRVCENAPGTVASQVGRWVLLSLGVSAVVHQWPAAYLGFALLLAALMLWSGDVLSCPLVFSPITGKSPHSVVAMAARQSYVGELMQYLIAMLALLLFRTGILWTGILWVDALGTLMVVLPIVLLQLCLNGESALRTDA